MEGQVDLDRTIDAAVRRMGLTITPEEKQKVTQEATRATESLKRRMSPKGALRLPPLLDARRLEWGIPDGAFRAQALYDRLLIWQIPPAFSTGDTIGGGAILKSEQTKLKELRECPRGIIISAGLKALDVLRSNGSDLGHIVKTVKNSIYGVQCDYDPETGKYDWLQVLRDSDLIDDEDLHTALISGACSVKAVKSQDQAVHHIFVDAEGNEWDPEMPWVPEE